MPVNATVTSLLDVARTASLVAGKAYHSTPIRLGERGLGSERTAAGKRLVLGVMRSRDGYGTGTAGGATASDKLAGTLAVYGADLPNPLAGIPLGNAYGQAATATSVRPQADVIVGDGSTTAFTTNIDLASADLTAYVNTLATAGVTGKLLVYLPKWRIAQDSSLAAITVTMTAAGVVTFSAAYDTLLVGSKRTDSDTSGTITDPLAVGDTLEIAGQALTIASIDSGTQVTVSGASAAVTSGVPCYVTTPRRRFLDVTTSSNDTASSNCVVASVSNSKLVLTFKVAPPAIGPAAMTTPTFGPKGAMPADPAAAYLVTPTEVLAAGTNEFQRVGIRGRSVYWCVLNTTANGTKVSATKVHVEHAAD